MMFWRAARGERVSHAEVMRMFGAAKDRKHQVASKETGDKRRRLGPQHEGPSAREEAKNEIAKANARAIMKEFGRNGAVLLLGMRENLLETLSFLEQEINSPNGPDEGGKA
jgi:hypothetical protein